ncbi:glycosyltransferase family 4 protein [Rhodopirellula sallentina]|nr:glycosyltransferase family 4 protein [Rhodopirellula sallentina]
MKIAFICGSLEPGRDGVGDYTRRLAGELIRKGHDARIVAAHDKGLPTGSTFVEESQDDFGTKIETYRLDKGTKWSEREAKILRIFDESTPDLVSLQFVPYSFHGKGFPFRFVSMIQTIAAEFSLQWQVMFHELWLGIGTEARLKEKLVGAIQKRIVSKIVRALPHAVLHSNTELSCSILAEQGLQCERLPLFSNIPRERSAAGNRVEIGFDDLDLIAIHFGSYSRNIRGTLSTVMRIHREARSKGKRLALISAGNSGRYGNDTVNALRDLIGEDRVKLFGKLEPRKISWLLTLADVGISKSSILNWQKSGSVLAMLEHGLNVYLQRTDRTSLLPLIGRATETEDDLVLQASERSGTLSRVADTMAQIWTDK